MATQTFYTYKPGANVPKKGQPPLAGNQLVLGPGETVGHGSQGYYAVPAPVAAPAASAPQPLMSAATPGRWNMPDYNALLAGDWEPDLAQKQGDQAIGDAEALFQKNLRTAFIDYGGDASKLGDYSKYIDQATIEAAKNNKFSQTAQNLAAMTKSLKQRYAALAARGMLGSGASTNYAKEALTARELADYTAMRSFLGGADQGMGGLANLRSQIADKIAQARSTAAARLAQQYPQTWEEGTPAAPTGSIFYPGEVPSTFNGEGWVPPPPAPVAAKPVPKSTPATDPYYYQKLKNMRAG